MAAELLLRAYQ